MAPNPVWVGGHLTPRGHHSHADAPEPPKRHQGTHDDRRPLRNAHSAPERPSSPKGHPRSRGVNSTAKRLVRAAGGSSPLTRGQRAGGPLRDVHSGVIPAHAGSTHSKPRNPANAATLAAATDAIGHPVEQPSVSDRARAEGLDRGGGENGAIKKSWAGVQGAAQSPPATPCEPGHQKPEVSDMVQVLHIPGQYVSVAV